MKHSISELTNMWVGVTREASMVRMVPYLGDCTTAPPYKIFGSQNLFIFKYKCIFHGKTEVLASEPKF